MLSVFNKGRIKFTWTDHTFQILAAKYFKFCKLSKILGLL